MSTRDIAIRAQDISKRYRLGVKETSADSVGAALLGMVKSPLKNFRKYRSLYQFEEGEGVSKNRSTDTEDILWALRGVSFEVRRGEVVGVIGTNGSGKSTLLKILSRITPPTTGRIEITGRVSSLLEVGTGFHPELTGRENVYLNGTILGMRKKEIDRVFDDIVEFSGVDRFLDTPVKRYSSGMRVRLAFSVAAHLEPEILIVDEVLAVGDAAFQRKCMQKMEDVGQQGRTVLFVSHNMPAVTRMCERVILLNQGECMADGTAHEVVSAYLQGNRESTAEKVWPDLAEAPGKGVARLRAVRVRDRDGRITEALDIRRPVGIEMEFEVLESGHIVQPQFGVFNDEGLRLFVGMDQDPEWRNRPRPAGRYVTTGWIPGNLLAEGMLIVNVGLWALEPVRERQCFERDVVAFHIIDSSDGDSARGDWGGDIKGVVRPMLTWETEADIHPERSRSIA